MTRDYSHYEYLLVTVENDIAVVTLNRPEKLNAPTSDAELISVWADLAEDDRLRAVVLTGAGKAFCAGGDIGTMAAHYRSAEGLKFHLNLVASARRLVDAILGTQLPIICAINGDAIGLGATLALLADVSVMSEDARIGDPHVKVGLVAGDGGSVIWPLLIGPHRAKEFLMRGNLVDGPEAGRLGLVNHVVPRADVVPHAMALATEIAANSPWAVRFTKMAINKWLRQQVELIFDASIAFEALSAFTDDHGEALEAIREKRTPKFKGT